MLVSADNEHLRFLDLPLDVLQAIARQLVCDSEREHRCCASALAAPLCPRDRFLYFS